MIKVVQNKHKNVYLAYDDEDVFNQKEGVSKANAIALVKYASNKHGIKVTEADMKIMRAACTPY